MQIVGAKVGGYYLLKCGDRLVVVGDKFLVLDINKTPREAVRALLSVLPPEVEKIAEELIATEHSGA